MSAQADHSLSQQFFNSVLDMIASLLPRLDQFTRTEWLVYHTPVWPMLSMLLAQSAIFLALLVGVSLFDLYRKNI
jgi:hypothetical protein